MILHIKELNYKNADGSKHRRMFLPGEKYQYVDFAILEQEMCAYMWDCEGNGAFFLSELERYASNRGYQLTIPTVLNKRLVTILEGSGYTMKEVPNNGDICELWSKW